MRGGSAGALALLWLAVCSASISAQTTVDRQIRQNQARLDSIRQERASLESELNRLRGRLRNISSELSNLERQKTATNRIVNELDRQMSSLGSQLDTITLDLLLAQDALAEKRAIRERRVVEIYKRGPLWGFQVLLAAESFSDLLGRYKYLYLVSRQDQALVAEVADLESRISLERQQLALVEQQLGRNRDERQLELERYRRLEAERQRSLQRARGSADRTTERLTELERNEQQINTLIANLERRRREAVAAGRATFPATITEDDLGSLGWPAEGEIAYRFGRAAGPYNTAVRYQGLGIRVPVGTPVRAVAGGQVVSAEPLGSYGPTVMINHGGGMFTVYLYLSSLTVTANQQVEGGAVIGLSGGAATEEGPHFEFQIRESRGPQADPIALDPLNWLFRR
jgi:septal ring factor EnvC (AmiA/AmiB activator)